MPECCIPYKQQPSFIFQSMPFTYSQRLYNMVLEIFSFSYGLDSGFIDCRFCNSVLQTSINPTIILEARSQVMVPPITHKPSLISSITKFGQLYLLNFSQGVPFSCLPVISPVLVLNNLSTNFGSQTITDVIITRRAYKNTGS